MSKKPIIVFEGIEGSGKTFHLNNVSNYLKRKKIPFLKIREPGGNKNSEIIFLKVQFGKIKPKHFKSKTYHKNIFYDSWDFNVYNRYD